MKAILKLTVVFQEAEEGGYIAFIEELPGLNTQGILLMKQKPIYWKQWSFLWIPGVCCQKKN